MTPFSSGELLFIGVVAIGLFFLAAGGVIAYWQWRQNRLW